MTAKHDTPETGESISDEQLNTGIQHVGALAAREHDLYAQGPTGHFTISHAGDVEMEVFTDRGVTIAADSEETARASTGIKLTAQGARQLAGLLEDAADELDTTGD